MARVPAGGGRTGVRGGDPAPVRGRGRRPGVSHAAGHPRRRPRRLHHRVGGLVPSAGGARFRAAGTGATPAAGPSASTSFVPTMPGPTRSAGSPPSTTTPSTGPASSDRTGSCPEIPPSPTRSFTSRSRTSAGAIASGSSGRRPSTWCCTPRSRGLRLEGAACTAVEIRTLDGHDLAIRADRFVLAAGGVENPRLLLLSAAEPAGAPGNAGGLVGRYFTDHAFVDPGTLVLREPDCAGLLSGAAGGPEPGSELGPGRPVTPPRGRGARAPHECGLVLPSPLRSPSGLRDRGGEGLPDSYGTRSKRRAVPGAGVAVCPAGRQSPSPAGRGDGTQACGETWAGTTLANACGLRDRVPVRQPRDAERRARPPRPAQGPHRVADR